MRNLITKSGISVDIKIAVGILGNLKYKKVKNLKYFAFFLILGFSYISTYSQTLPVGTSVLEEYYRRAQLLGKIDANTSFTVRPLFPIKAFQSSIFDPDSMLAFSRSNKSGGRLEFDKKRGAIQLLPLSFLNQLNDHHPVGINDGAMIPAKGYQTLMSTGIFFKYGPLSVQLKPEFVYAENKDFVGFPSNYTSTREIKFPATPYLNIDFPERFGDTIYTKAFWGQSSIRLTVGSFSIGLSNENLWWGPGYRNSLLMTNSAPGFKHFTFNTVKPIKTFIGSFETQIIAGQLEGSGYTPNLREDWRYINAMVFTYQPKWIHGLFLGASRAFLIYNNDMGNGFGDYLPVFSFLTKASNGSEDEVNNQGQNQLISVFMRWLFVEAKGEIYFEYGREDHAWDLRDLTLEPSHSSAYIIGFRKLITLNAQKETHIQIISELANFASPQTTINRNSQSSKPASNWYSHGGISYYNIGQSLGAGIDPGSNLQTIDISWVKSLKQIGIQVERYVHNNDFWYNWIKDIRSNWVDINTTAYVNWDYKHFHFNIKLSYIRSKNYQWLYEPEYVGTPEFWTSTEDTPSFHGQLGITYRF